jgi:hypothetical protein
MICRRNASQQKTMKKKRKPGLRCHVELLSLVPVGNTNWDLKTHIFSPGFGVSVCNPELKGCKPRVKRLSPVVVLGIKRPQGF